MHGFWNRLGLHTALGQFMAAVDNPTQPQGPPDVTRAIHLAHADLLARHVPLSDVAETAWQLGAFCQDGSTHDLALVTALYFLADPHALPPSLEHVRRDARHRAQEWVTKGWASVGVAGRFEEALFQRSF